MQIFVMTRSLVSPGNWRSNICLCVCVAEMQVFPRQESHGNQLQNLSYSLLLLSYKVDTDWEVCMTHFLLSPTPSKTLPCEIFLIIIFNVTQKTALHLSCPLDWLITYFYFAFSVFFTLPVRQILISAFRQEGTQFTEHCLCPEIRGISWDLLYPRTAAF